MLDEGTGGFDVSDARLIDPSKFELKAWELWPSSITESASALRKMGSAVRDEVGDIHSSWSGLKQWYEAPEQERVYNLMDPSLTSAREIRSTLRKTASHLDTYAEALAGIKPRLASLEKRALEFRAEAACGFPPEDEEDSSSAVGPSILGEGTESGPALVSWHEVGSARRKNAALHAQYAALREEVARAVATCANSINGLVEGWNVPGVTATPAGVVTSAERPMPWGAPAAQGHTCPEAVGQGSTAPWSGVTARRGDANVLDSAIHGQGWPGATTVAGVAGLLGPGRGSAPGIPRSLAAAQKPLSALSSGGNKWVPDGVSWTSLRNFGLRSSANALGTIGLPVGVAVPYLENVAYPRWKESGMTWFEGLFVPWALPKKWRNRYIGAVDGSTDWANNLYKKHVANHPQIRPARWGLGKTSDALGWADTYLGPGLRQGPATSMAVGHAIPMVKGEVDDWNHILHDPKGWWDQASGIDQAGISVSAIPGAGLVGKGTTKTTKELFDLLGNFGKHGDDVKKAPDTPLKTSGPNDSPTGSGRSGSDGGGASKGHGPDPSKGPDNTAPKSDSNAPDGGRPNKGSGGGARSDEVQPNDGGQPRGKDPDGPAGRDAEDGVPGSGEKELEGDGAGGKSDHRQRVGQPDDSGFPREQVVPDAPQSQVVDSSGRDITDVLDASGLDRDALAKYLEGGRDPDKAQEFASTGRWPEDVQVPRGPEVLKPNGRIDWDQAPNDGFATSNGVPIRDPFAPVKGQVIDRYGSSGGLYVSPVPQSGAYSYGQRSLPYVEDPGMYHRYEVIGDMSDMSSVIRNHPDAELRSKILRKLEYYEVDIDSMHGERGPVAPAFGQPGGGEQYRLPMSVADLEDLGLIREISKGGTK